MTSTVDTGEVPLVCEPLELGEEHLARSGIQWLVPDGSPCSAGEPIAYAHVGFTKGADRARSELRDFQVAFVPTVSGRVSWRRDVGASGWDSRIFCKRFDPNESIGTILPSSPSSDAGRLRLLWLAGRRVVDFGGKNGFMVEWSDRARGWWGDTRTPPQTVLAAGICSLDRLVAGQRGAFAELFAQCPGPAHVVQATSSLLVPSSVVLQANIDRTSAEAGQIGAEVGQWIQSAAPDGFAVRGRFSIAQDIFFVTHLLSELAAPSPLLDEYAHVGPRGMFTLGPAPVVLLSLDSEGAYHLRHKALGYPVAIHGFRLAEISPTLKAWFRANFERIDRKPEDVERDLLALVDKVQSLTGARLVFVNSVESNSFRFPRSAPASLSARARNVILDEVSRKRPISVIDADAIAVDLGVHAHVPDATHPYGDFERELRTELVRTLRAMGIAGY